MSRFIVLHFLLFHQNHILLFLACCFISVFETLTHSPFELFLLLLLTFSSFFPKTLFHIFNLFLYSLMARFYSFVKNLSVYFFLRHHCAMWGFVELSIFWKVCYFSLARLGIRRWSKNEKAKPQLFRFRSCKDYFYPAYILVNIALSLYSIFFLVWSWNLLFVDLLPGWSYEIE